MMQSTLRISVKVLIVAKDSIQASELLREACPSILVSSFLLIYVF